MDAQKRVAWRVPGGISDQVFEGELRWGPDQSLPFILVEARGAPLQAFVDLNRNQVLEETQERLLFEPSPDPGFDQQTLLRIPLTGGVFSFFPLRIRFLKHSVEQDGQVFSARAISWNSFAALRGTVDIDGEVHRLTLEGFLPGRLQIDPKQAILGIDTNSDGMIDFSPLSPEWAISRNEIVVFRVRKKYVSFASPDLSAGRIPLQSHSSAEYIRIELRRGNQLPDFSFVDFEGHRRSLNEFRGKFLLLDFWGSWCGPCIAEFPNLVATYAEFKDRGFEILGMNADPAPQQLRRGVTSQELATGISKARQAVQTFAAVWPQARTESIMKLVLERFRIYAYPTSILLDPEGRVVSRNDPDRPLRGLGLGQTLSELLPARGKGSRVPRGLIPKGKETRGYP